MWRELSKTSIELWGSEGDRVRESRSPAGEGRRRMSFLFRQTETISAIYLSMTTGATCTFSRFFRPAIQHSARSRFPSFLHFTETGLVPTEWRAYSARTPALRNRPIIGQTWLTTAVVDAKVNLFAYFHAMREAIDQRISRLQFYQCDTMAPGFS